MPNKALMLGFCRFRGFSGAPDSKHLPQVVDVTNAVIVRVQPPPPDFLYNLQQILRNLHFSLFRGRGGLLFLLRGGPVNERNVRTRNEVSVDVHGHLMSGRSSPVIDRARTVLPTAACSPVKSAVSVLEHRCLRKASIAAIPAKVMSDTDRGKTIGTDK